MVGDFEIVKLKSTNERHLRYFLFVYLRFLISHYLSVLMKPNTTNNLRFFNKNFNSFFGNKAAVLLQSQSQNWMALVLPCSKIGVYTVTRRFLVQQNFRTERMWAVSFETRDTFRWPIYIFHCIRKRLQSELLITRTEKW